MNSSGSEKRKGIFSCGDGVKTSLAVGKGELNVFPLRGDGREYGQDFFQRAPQIPGITPTRCKIKGEGTPRSSRQPVPEQITLSLAVFFRWSEVYVRPKHRGRPNKIPPTSANFA